MMSFHWITLNLMTMLIASIPLNLKSKILQKLKCLQMTISQMTMDILLLSWIQIRSYTGCDSFRLWLYTGFEYWVTRRVPLVVQQFLTLLGYLNWLWFLLGSRYLSFSFQCNVVCSMCVFRLFFVGHGLVYLPTLRFLSAHLVSSNSF